MSNSKLNISVEEVMLSLNQVACVKKDTFLKNTIEQMSKKSIGIAFVLHDDGKLYGVFTDGDIRRMILKNQKPISSLFVDDISQHCNINPIYIKNNTMLIDAIKIMEDNGICDLPVINEDKILCGLIHLHPAIKKVLD